jgi:hypothetical protein
VALETELRRIAEAAGGFCGEGEELAGVVPAEPELGVRVYVCAYRDGEATSWLVLDTDGAPVEELSLVREAVSIAGLCELADEAAGTESAQGPRVATPGHLDEIGAVAPDRVRLAEAMKHGAGVVGELLRDVERSYKGRLR